MDDDEILQAASSEGLRRNTSTVYGSIAMPDNLENNQKLVRVTEISNAGLRRHSVDLKNVWRTQIEQVKSFKNNNDNNMIF